MQEWQEAWRAVPGPSKTRRVVLVALVAAGLCFAVFRSFLYQSMIPVPVWYVPDARLPFLAAVTAVIGGYASMGESARRVQFLLFATAVAALAHVEVSTIHWFTSEPGSLTGVRLDLPGFAGSMLALTGVALLHVEVEAWRYAADLRERGAPAPSAEAMARHLSRLGSGRVGMVAGAVVALGVLVVAAERVMAQATLGTPVIALAAGGVLLAFGLHYAVKSVGSNA